MEQSHRWPKRVWNLSFQEQKFKISLILILILLIEGCARLNSIHRTQTLPVDQPYSISVDAKQRVILSSPEKNLRSLLTSLETAKNIQLEQCKLLQSSNAETSCKAAEEHYKTVLKAFNTYKKSNDTGIVRFCAEPPPDVFTAIASSLGVKASFSKAAAKEASAKIASTLSENASTIERTQAVNVLREAMYRNCERYLSGAISKDELIVQAARDQQLIIQVLAIEQITGVAKAQSTALTTVAKAAAGGISDASLASLVATKKGLETKRTAFDTAEENAKKLLPKDTDKICSSAPLDENSPPTGITDVPEINDACESLKKAEKELKEAEELFAVVKKAVSEQGAVSSDAYGELSTAVLNTAAVSEAIADRVVDIVQEYQKFDEIKMSCVVRFRRVGEVDGFCKKYIIAVAEAKAAQKNKEKAQYDKEAAQKNKEAAQKNKEAIKLNIEAAVLEKRRDAILSSLISATQEAADIVWKKLGYKADESKLKTLAEDAGVSLNSVDQKDLIAAGSDFDAFYKIFKNLPSDIKQKLANATIE